MLNLPPKILKAVRNVLRQHVPGGVVWAYGSRVTGRSHSGSDLDLVIRKTPRTSARRINLGALKESFSESNVPILVDVQDWSRLPESFQREIERAHVVL